MKTKTLLCAALVALCTMLVVAQDASSQPKAKSHVRTITGCLSQGDSANEFQLTTKDGSTWEARSDQVPLAKHLGHAVTVTGVVSHAKMHNLKEDAKQTGTDTGAVKPHPEHGHMEITSLKMVSDSCQ
jgi:ABC-type sugar transport system substrate-binding protein